MPMFLVTYAHPDDTGWQAHIMAHVAWLQEQVKAGSVIASGPMPGEADRAALLIMAAPNEAQLRALIETDPFAKAGLIANLTVRNWDPIFGCFNAQSSMVGMFGQG
jgi:uncharacterized protein